MCFTGTLLGKIKSAGIKKKIIRFKEKVLEWQKYNHEFGEIYENIDWSNLEEAWAHKFCKGNFFKETYMTNQPLKINKKHNEPSSSYNVENASTSLLPLPRKSSRQLLSYTFSGKNAVCIACNEKKYKKGREVEVKTMSIKKLKVEKKVNRICSNSYI